MDDAAVAVARVLAQAHVRHDQHLWHGVLYRAGGELDDALGVVSAAPGLVFLGGEAEEQHTRDAEVVSPPGLLYGVVDGELEDAGHRAYRAPDVLADGHEHRVDKVLRREPRLAHEAAQRGRATGPAESLRGERHGNGPPCCANVLGTRVCRLRIPLANRFRHGEDGAPTSSRRWSKPTSGRSRPSGLCSGGPPPPGRGRRRDRWRCRGAPASTAPARRVRPWRSAQPGTFELRRGSSVTAAPQPRGPPPAPLGSWC